MLQLDIFSIDGAREGRDAGMQRAADNTGIEWCEKAYDHLATFVHMKGQLPFMIEDVSRWAYLKGLPKPKHERAWGAVATAAIKQGIIEKIGIGKVKRVSSHRANASIYKRSLTTKT